jgi:hypothetical protein
MCCLRGVSVLRAHSGWNRLDFIVLFVGVLSHSGVVPASGISQLRALRALRPLRTLHFFAPLQIILKSVWRATGLLANVLVCVGFLYFIFGLTGVQLFQGALQRRCVVPVGDDALRFNVSSPGFAAQWAALRHADAGAIPRDYRVFMPETFCSLESLPLSFQCANLRQHPVVDVAVHGGAAAAVTVPLVCARTGTNPLSGRLHFDHLGGAIYSVFMASTLEV